MILIDTLPSRYLKADFSPCAAGLSCAHQGLCVPQPAEAESMGVRQLYESLASRIAPIPSGFLEDLAARFEGDGLEDFIIPNGLGSLPAFPSMLP